MPEGNKSRVLEVGVESNRPATNLPLGSLGSNQVYRMVKKRGLGVKNPEADFMGASGWSRVGLPIPITRIWVVSCLPRLPSK